MTAPIRPNPFAQLRIGLGLQRDVPGTLDRIASRYGNAVDIGLGPQRYILLLGVEANRDILLTHADSFRWGPVLSSLIPVDGPTALVVTDGEDHDRRRRIVQPAFHIRRINGYLHTMVAEIDATIDDFVVGGTVDVHAAFRRCIRRIVLRTLLGDELAAGADDLGDDLEAAIDYVQRNPTQRIDRWFFPPFRRAMAARARADERIHAEIRRRRDLLAEGAEPGDDVLWWLIAAGRDDSTPDASTPDADLPLSDEEIRDQAVSLVAAGYDTTSAAAGWALHAVVSHPEVRDAIGAEVAGADFDDASVIGRLPQLDGAVRETLRLWSPGTLSGREAAAAVTVAGTDVPAGRKVLYSAYRTHRDPAHYPDPEAFRPARWIGTDIEPYAYVPFGGGTRRCIGHAFATLELQALVGRFVQRVDATVTGPTPPGAGIATWAPQGGVVLRIDAVRSPAATPS